MVDSGATFQDKPSPIYHSSLIGQHQSSNVRYLHQHATRRGSLIFILLHASMPLLYYDTISTIQVFCFDGWDVLVPWEAHGGSRAGLGWGICAGL
ncbi:hypothetical protein IAQ61_001769 [Plenodomus lingam]|uniref:uncharacterized protein n=1 Tax=Leptosphaeria maculans TaxID=5022 RepID=UPI00332EF343|nr:hypothetical protein IAQ61_001769 [Plenodomus lingam]